MSSTTLFNVLLLLFHFFITSSSTHATTYTRSHPLSSTTVNSSNQETKGSPNLNDTNSSSAADTVSFIQRKFKNRFLTVSDTHIKFLAEHAGFIPFPDTINDRMFYFFFHSHNDEKNDPFILWLSGGPGASGSTALFYENGPFILKDDFSLVENEYSWDKMSNILFVDQPMGTGLSHISDDDDIRHDLNKVIDDLYLFLQEFFKGRHRDFSQNDFFIIGQTYAGHYAPALASRIQRGNNEPGGIHIHLKGFAIGNGHINPKIQYPTIPEYARSHNIIDEDRYSLVAGLIPSCVSSTINCETGNDEDACVIAFNYCSKMVHWIRSVAEDINFGNMEKPREGPSNNDFSTLNMFLNMESMKEALSLGGEEFVSLNPKIFNAMIKDYMKNIDFKISDLLQERKIKVLVYVGDQDLINNWEGNKKWVSQMDWYGREEFSGAPDDDFVVDDETVGSKRSYGPLTLIKVFKAGHMVPMDQPKVAFQMIQDWMQTVINE